MQAALIVAPAPFCGQLLRAGAALFHAAARLFAAKETSKATAQDDVSARAAQILDAHGNAILRYAYSYLHNMADAEEVLQDTLVQFLKTAPRFESEAHEKAWLLRVAGNLSKNRLSYNAVRAADELRIGRRKPGGSVLRLAGSPGFARNIPRGNPPVLPRGLLDPADCTDSAAQRSNRPLRSAPGQAAAARNFKGGV